LWLKQARIDPEKAAKMPKPKILIVEDETLLSVRLSKHLASSGYEIAAVAASGEDAVQAALNTRPDAVLMDINLDGDIDGIEAAEQIRSQMDAAIVYLTGYAADQDLFERAKATGPAGFLTKPVSRQDLNRALAIALYKRESDRRVREGEERYRRLFESSLDSVATITDYGRILEINPAGCQMLGYELEELRGINAAAVWADPAELAECRRKMREHGTVANFEWKARKKDGAVIDCILSASQWRADDGQLLYQTIWRDITVQKKALEALKGSEARFRQAFEHAATGMVLAGLDGRFLKANRAMCDIMGYSEQELQAKDFSAITHPDDLEMSRNVLKDLLSGERDHYRLDKRYIRKDQRVVWAHVSVACVRDSQGAPLHFVAQIVDITRRVEIENELRRSKEDWERTFDAMPDLIALLDGEQRIVRCNRAMLESLGSGGENLLGTKCFECFHDCDEPPAFCPYLPSAKDRRTHSEEVYIDKLGKHFLVSTSPFFDSEGSPSGCVHVARDISQMKANEERQRQLNEEIKHFAYIVSHDLRAPLANLRGFSRVLKEAVAVIRSALESALGTMPASEKAKLDEAMNVDLPEALGFIDSSISHMDRLISAVLKLSRLGRSELKFESLNMNELVRDILKTFAHSVSDNRIEVLVADLPAAWADRTAMEQVFSNLIGNAIKFADPDRPQEIRITGRSYPNETVFAVRDKGLGIKDSDLSKIFYVFERAAPPGVPGEGMGLAYTRTLVRRHGGRISCESEPGVGSTFTFSISNRLDPID
jgi:PAS domain S-box-containing protein